jgi:hypothetical protein
MEAVVKLLLSKEKVSLESKDIGGRSPLLLSSSLLAGNGQITSITQQD